MSLVIDTDIGTDVDDLFALAYAFKSGFKVGAVSTVLGDTEVRAKLVRKLERMLGKDIPIIAGRKGPKQSVERFWTGIEEQALTEEERAEPFISADFPKYDSNSSIVGIGPMTNLAYQLKNNPSITNVKRIYLMGSQDASHNFEADPKAAKAVLSAPWDIYVVTKEVSEQVTFTRKELEQFKGTPLGDFLYTSAMNWLDYTGRDKACMYDVLAVSAAAGEDFVKFRKLGQRHTSVDVDLKLKQAIIGRLKCQQT